MYIGGTLGGHWGELGGTLEGPWGDPGGILGGFWGSREPSRVLRHMPPANFQSTPSLPLQGLKKLQKHQIWIRIEYYRIPAPIFKFLKQPRSHFRPWGAPLYVNLGINSPTGAPFYIALRIKWPWGVPFYVNLRIKSPWGAPLYVNLRMNWFWGAPLYVNLRIKLPWKVQCT